MRRAIIFLPFLFVTLFLRGQSPDFSAKDYHRNQVSIERTGMLVLGSWAAANIASGAYFAGKTGGSTQYYHRMNMYWGVVNGALAASALFRLPKTSGQTATYAGLMRTQQKLEKTFLLNAGLDLAYLAAGIALKESSKNNPAKRDRRFGYGNSLLLQGGFLLLFDGIMYTTLHRKGRVLDKMLDRITLNAGANGVGILARL